MMTLQEIERLKYLCQCDPKASIEIIIALKEEDYNSLIDNSFYTKAQSFIFFHDFFTWTETITKGHYTTITYQPSFIDDKRRSR